MIFKVSFKVVNGLPGTLPEKEVFDRLSPEKVTTMVGFRVAETPDTLVLAQAVTTGRLYTNPVRIPQDLIIECEVIDG